MENSKHSLIMAVVCFGFAEAVVSAVRDIAAPQSVVIHARRAGYTKKGGFLGIEINTEKEIVSMLIPNEHKNEIMKKIGEACGITTEARGVIFSLPVCEVY